MDIGDHQLVEVYINYKNGTRIAGFIQADEGNEEEYGPEYFKLIRGREDQICGELNTNTVCVWT